ncbi:MAG: cryptochrome/photolyase family protein [Akkermansiaceae bacterium]
MKKCIIWLRKDLRLNDHPGFAYAIQQGYQIIPVFIWDDAEHRWQDGAASRWWLHHALKDLEGQIEELGGKLIIHELGSSNTERDRGKFSAEVMEIFRGYEADAIYWGRRYEPEIIERDKRLKYDLTEEGYEVKSFNTHLLLEPHTIKNKSGSHFKVFTPYWKHCLTHSIAPVIEISAKEWAEVQWGEMPSPDCVDDLDLLPEIPWDEEFYEYWGPTRKEGLARLSEMVESKAGDYDKMRDIPSVDGTSQLSPYLQWGQVSAREVYHAFGGSYNDTVEKGYLRQLFWREFSYHLLFHAPHSVERPLRPEYENFPWKAKEKYLTAWQKGETGFPIVDAGMRQLWQTGWMHNRVRMIVGSFLVKHLLQDWREGASWFWDTLVDADLANNTMGWQWIGGCGADASPYFRIFNPIIQGEKFDPDGEYVRRYCPELKDVPSKYIHKPWEMPELELVAAGVTLGKTYPQPVISHEDGRASALDAYGKFKELNKEQG